MTEKKELKSNSVTCFDPRVYVTQMFSSFKGDPTEDAFLKFELDSLHEIYNRDEVTGDRLLDIGSGPVVHHVFLAAKKFKQIFLSDLHEENLEMLRQWKAGEYHQESMFKYMITLEGSGEEFASANRRLSLQIGAILKYDLHQESPLSGTIGEGLQFDAISLCLCQNSAASSANEYQQAVHTYSGLLKPGGHVIVFDTLGDTFYTVGDQKFRQFKTTKEELQNIYKTCGFDIISWRQMDFPYNPDLPEYSDLKGSYAMLARKRSH